MQKALLIEPEPFKGQEIADLLRDVLRGGVVEHAKDGREALEKLQRLKVQGGAPADLILLDVMMPGLEGADVLRMLRDASPTTPVLVLTGTVFERPRQETEGLVTFLTKPVSSDALRSAIRKVLRNRPKHAQEKPWGPHSGSAHVVRELHEPGTGRLDAKRIADYLAVPLSALAAAVDIKTTTAHKTPASTSAQEKLAPIAWIVGVLFLLFRDRNALLAWLNSPHPDLGARTPMSFIMEGKATAISEMLEATLAGQPS